MLFSVLISSQPLGQHAIHGLDTNHYSTFFPLHRVTPMLVSVSTLLWSKSGHCRLGEDDDGDGASRVELQEKGGKQSSHDLQRSDSILAEGRIQPEAASAADPSSRHRPTSGWSQRKWDRAASHRAAMQQGYTKPPPTVLITMCHQCGRNQPGTRCLRILCRQCCQDKSCAQHAPGWFGHSMAWTTLGCSGSGCFGPSLGTIDFGKKTPTCLKKGLPKKNMLCYCLVSCLVEAPQKQTNMNAVRWMNGLVLQWLHRLEILLMLQFRHALAMLATHSSPYLGINC